MPPRETIVRKASPRQEYALAARYPEARRSRRLGWGVFGRLPARNPGFAALVGAIQTLLMLSVAETVRTVSDTEGRLVTIPLALMVLVVLGGAVGLAYIPTGGPKGGRHFLAGTLHGVLHLALGLLGGLLWAHLPVVEWTWPLPLLVAMLLYLPVAGLAGSLLVAAYLLVAAEFEINLNELFAAQGIEDYKSFLRLHIARDGSLTIYPVGIDRVCRRWRADPDADRPDAPWIVPDQPDRLRPRLVEDPITIR